MSNSKIQFQRNIDSIKILHDIHQYFEKQLHAVDLSEILRAEYVLIISALDCFIHDVVREGMIDIFDGRKSANNGFDDFKLPMAFVKLLLDEPDQTQRNFLLSSAIKKVASKESYQSPTSITNALGLIGIKKIWTQISPEFNMKPDDISKKLGIIINRRNKIAHEADIDNITGLKTPISRSDLTETIEFIELLVESIEKLTSTT